MMTTTQPKFYMENATPATTLGPTPSTHSPTPTTIIEVDDVNFSYDSKVDVLPLAPGLQVPVNAIRAVSQPQSLLVKAITREMQKVLAAQL